MNWIFGNDPATEPDQRLYPRLDALRRHVDGLGAHVCDLPARALSDDQLRDLYRRIESRVDRQINDRLSSNATAANRRRRPR